MSIQRRKRQQHQRLDQVDRDSEYNEEDEDHHDGIDGIFRDAMLVDTRDEHLDRAINNGNVDNNRNRRSNYDEKSSTEDSNKSTDNAIRISDDNGSIHYLDIDEAIERLGMGRFQHGIFLACGLCFAADAMVGVV